MSREAVREGPNPAAPAVVRSTSLDHGGRRSFLADVVIEHGPRDLLGRLFLQADTRLREKGVRISFATVDELVAVNRANADTWRPILPLYDPAVSAIGPHNSHALLGWNAAGEIVCAHGCRLYDLGADTLKNEIESLRLFYRDPERARGPGEAMVCTAPTAATTSGRMVFTGAVWYRPDYRKLGIMPIFSTMNRAVLATRWGPEFVFSFMAADLVRAGVAKASRMPHAEDEIRMIRTPVYRDGILPAALVWCTSSEYNHLFAEFIGKDSSIRDAQVDRRIENRTTDQKLAS